ncbi:MAG: DUF4294 domain-containing protein [Chitinophagaceae bacterium]
MFRGRLLIQIFAIGWLIALAPVRALAQIEPVVAPDTLPPMPSFAERAAKWGPNDTIITDAVWYGREMLSYREGENVWISKLSARKLEKIKKEYNRLRNAVYVTYPYARVAGRTINEINQKLATIKDKKARKAYLKTREKELREQFSEPLSNLSVYQGRVLMKLINRQTGNNCYHIIKEYKGAFNARVYQTVAFFFGSNLKQDYDLSDKTDRQIENFVMEIDGAWYGNPYRK